MPRPDIEKIRADIENKTLGIYGINGMICNAIPMPDTKSLLDYITALEATNATMIADLNGMCWCCANAEPWKLGLREAYTCDYMRERGVLAGRHRKCDKWLWRGVRRDGEQ